MNLSLASLAATSLSITLSGAVLLCGAHAKDIVSASSRDHGLVHKVFGDDATITKVTTDLHNHVDKQGAHSLISLHGDQTMQADQRSLRPSHHVKHKSRLADRLLAWWQFSSLHI